jgi:hypothetical protein
MEKEEKNKEIYFMYGNTLYIALLREIATLHIGVFF